MRAQYQSSCLLVVLGGSVSMCASRSQQTNHSQQSVTVGNPATNCSTIPSLLASISSTPLSVTSQQHNQTVSAECSIEALHQALWNRWVGESRNDQQRHQDFTSHRPRIGESTMNYTATTRGSAPTDGRSLFIALHGGGGAPAVLNDSQWVDMQRYYLDSVSEGIYIAPRGITNTWNLHFQPQSYGLYERIIADMVTFANVNPNRVYLLGFSAGGDGVYQIVPRIADRLAAANMSSGHPNDSGPVNYANVPFLIQVGSEDTAYDRNRVGPTFYRTLQTLRTSFPELYTSECFVHAGEGHNYFDNHPSGALQTVFSNPVAWLERNDGTTTTRDTNAIHWLVTHVRQPLPSIVRWDLNYRNPTPSHGSVASYSYWLGTTENASSTNPITARIDRAQNRIMIENQPSELHVFLRTDMLDLTRRVEFIVQGRGHSLALRPKLSTMARSVLARNDPYYIFDVEVVIRSTQDTVTVEQGE